MIFYQYQLKKIEYLNYKKYKLYKTKKMNTTESMNSNFEFQINYCIAHIILLMISILSWIIISLTIIFIGLSIICAFFTILSMIINKIEKFFKKD
jgi:uncharacterized Tic20 family protein